MIRFETFIRSFTTLDCSVGSVGNCFHLFRMWNFRMWNWNFRMWNFRMWNAVVDQEISTAFDSDLNLFESRTMTTSRNQLLSRPSPVSLG